MTLTRLTPLDGDSILPLAEAKAQLRVINGDEDALIGALRDAAIAHVERVSGVILAEAEFRWTVPQFSSCVELPVRPVRTVDAVTYNDASGDPVSYADARLVDGKVYPAAGGSWPYANGYAAVEFTAGLASPDDAPDLMAAVRLQLTVLEDRGRNDPNTIEALKKAVQALTDTHRRVLV